MCSAANSVEQHALTNEVQFMMPTSSLSTVRTFDLD